MKKALIYTIILASMPLLAIRAQTEKDSRLRIGDTVPDLVLTNVINTSDSTIQLADHKGKLIILDFWASFCAPCINAFPRLDSLQREFKDEIAILPITGDYTETVEGLLQRRDFLRNVELPFVTKTSLKEYFPYRFVSHVVWIDQNGKVVAFTNEEEITRERIIDVLKGDVTFLKPKNEPETIDDNKPLLLGYLGDFKFNPDHYEYGSVITRGFEGIGSMTSRGASRVDNGDKIRLKTTNQYIQKLYAIATTDARAHVQKTGESETMVLNSENYLFQPARILWEARDSSMFLCEKTKRQFDDLPWSEYVFHFEMTLPAADSSRFKTYMLQDLNRYFGARFGLEGLREKRKVQCMALTITGDESQFRSKGGERKMLVKRGERGMKYVNADLDQILLWWVPFHLPYLYSYPIINDTGYTGTVDLDLGDVDPKNFDEVNEALKRFGLEFKLVERDIDMIVIRDKQRSSS